MSVWCAGMLVVGGGALLVFTFAGYPLLLGLLARGRPAAPTTLPPGQAWPSLSVVLAAHNEAGRIVTRLANLLASDYPADLLQIILVSDGSTDDTAAVALALGDARIQVLTTPSRQGKAAALNLGVAAARGEVLIFTDARQHFAPGSLRALAAPMADPQVGAVSGRLTIAPAQSAVGAGVDLYWRLESFLRAAEGRYDSCVGCSGAIYALRRSLYEDLPEDTILDDVVVPMRAAARGYRVLYATTATAWDPLPSDPAREQVRKRRTLEGNFQMLARYPGWLLPWRHRLWWQLLAHKYLRLLAPLLLVTVLVANVALWPYFWARPLLALQALFYGCAVVGMLAPQLKLRLFTAPAGFVFLNAMTVRGLVDFLRGRSRRGWQIAR